MKYLPQMFLEYAMVTIALCAVAVIALHPLSQRITGILTEVQVELNVR